MLEIGKLSVQRILSDRSMTRECARWVPRLRNEDQIQSGASAEHESAMKDREVQYSTQILSYKIEVPHGLV